MPKRQYLIALAVLALLLILPITVLLCGTERWAIKVCKDNGVTQLFDLTHGDCTWTKGRLNCTANLKTPVDTTITALQSVPAPLKPRESRIAPTETTIWTIDATLTDYKEEVGKHGDRDYHLALKDASGKTMIAEIPASSCLRQTPEPLRSLITQARADFDSRFNATGQFKKTNTRVRVTGVGFFDKLHGQRGLAPNGIEIHPVIKIEFP
jgi:hypothetical protein